MKKEQAANNGRTSESGGNEELLKILRDIVTFHGEMVLLENYSSLNYTGKCAFAVFTVELISHPDFQDFTSFESQSVGII